MKSPHDCKDELKEAYLKSTPARLTIMRLLETASKPVDVFTLASDLKELSVDIDIATIFRIINKFEEKGLVRPVRFLNRTKYEVTSKGDHRHLICRICLNIDDMPDSTLSMLDKEVQGKTGFIITNRSLEIWGICSDCQK